MAKDTGYKFELLDLLQMIKRTWNLLSRIDGLSETQDIFSIMFDVKFLL